MRFRADVDYYQVLHLDQTASQDAVKQSYRILMGKMGAHPDLGGDEEQAKLINEAYSVLRNPTLRTAYDDARAKPTRRTTDPGRRSGMTGDDVRYGAQMHRPIGLAALLAGVRIDRPTVHIAASAAVFFVAAAYTAYLTSVAGSDVPGLLMLDGGCLLGWAVWRTLTNMFMGRTPSGTPWLILGIGCVVVLAGVLHPRDSYGTVATGGFIYLLVAAAVFWRG